MKACHSPSYARDAADTHARAKLFQHSVGRYHRQGGARHVGHLWHKRASDALAACAFERGDLQVGVLVIGGDAGIADFHAVIFGLNYRTRKPLFLWAFVFVRKSILCATGHHGCHTRFLAQSGCGGEGSRSSARRLRRPVRRQPRAQSLLIVCAIQAAIVYPRGVTAKALAPARKPIERHIYELARKHCGDSQEFRIGLPNYRVSMERDIVTFTTRKDRILDGNARFPMLMPETFEKARRVAPGWDIYCLEGL
jgi:hypothetical protein